MRSASINFPVLVFTIILSGTGIIQHRTSEARTVSNESSLPPIPEGAIKIGDDIYQVPIGKDSDGCDTYRMFSQHKGVVAAIFYRAEDGTFTMDKSKVTCSGG